MIEADRVWLAAVIDCEGTICLGKSARKSKRADGSVVRYVTYTAIIHLTNTYRPMLERAALLMGTHEAVQRRGSRLGRKPVYSVFLRDRKRLLDVLIEIEPHLMEKRELAQRLIDWLRWFDANRSPERGKCAWKYRRETRAEYDEQAEHVRAVMSRRKAA